MIKLAKEYIMDKQEMRQAYSDALIAAAATDPRIVILDCDLASSIGTKSFYKAQWFA